VSRERRPVRPARAVAAFDSASAMLRATARALRGKDFAHLGQNPAAAAATRATSAMPWRLRRTAYTVAGAAEGVPVSRLGDVDTDAIAAWAAGQYPRRRYPAVLIGSSNGAAVHLAAALGAPWLPQTVLVPVRWSGNDPDRPDLAMAFGRRVAAPLLARNPDVVLHHMHDGNQDRLMISRMTYFRLKRQRLGAAYERFLTGCLAPGAPILLVDDRSRWPTTRVDERHVFQVGARGGLTAEEYLRGSPALADMLRRAGSSRDRLPAPEPDGESAEAEWGLDEALAADVERWASAYGHPVHRVRIDAPQELSEPVAELYRQWLRERGYPDGRLLVESFVLLDPVHALRAGLVPYWTVFPVDESADLLARHLAEPGRHVDEAYLMLFSHGVRSAGLAGPGRWREVVGHARAIQLLGVDESRFPADFGVFGRFGPALRRVRAEGPEPALPVGGLTWERAGPMLSALLPSS
jgi:hypothetical protein